MREQRQSAHRSGGSVLVAEQSTAVERRGSSNTRLTDKFVVKEAGIDTAVAAFKINREYFGKEYDQYGDGDNKLTSRFFPAYGMVQVQGHPGGCELAPDDALADFVESCARRFDLGHFLGFSRIDSTATVAFEDPREGAALLQAAATVRMPYIKPATHGNPLETVYLESRRGHGKKFARVYDKGVESRVAPAGTLIRFEDQRRFKSSGRRLVAGIRGQELFEKRFSPMATATSTVLVASAPAAVERLFELHREGTLAEAKARRLAGFVCQYGYNVPMHPRSEQRGKKELIALGIALTDQHLDAPPVDLASVVGATIESKEWR